MRIHKWIPCVFISLLFVTTDHLLLWIKLWTIYRENDGNWVGFLLEIRRLRRWLNRRRCPRCSCEFPCNFFVIPVVSSTKQDAFKCHLRPRSTFHMFVQEALFLTSCPQTLSCSSSKTIWHLSQMSLSSDITTDSSLWLFNRSGQRVEETYQDQEEEDITWSSSMTDWCQKLCKPNILTSIMTWMTMILPMMQKWLSLVPPVSRVCLYQK